MESPYQTWITYERAGKDWIASSLATKIKHLFKAKNQVLHHSKTE
jgi:hypothetical protein